MDIETEQTDNDDEMVEIFWDGTMFVEVPDKINPTPITLEGWISVKDRLPEEGQMCIILETYGYDEHPFISRYEKGYFLDPHKSWYEDNMFSPDYWLPFTVKMPEK